MLQSLQLITKDLIQRGKQAPILPSLALGGIGCMYAAKGLFLTHKMLQQTMVYGIETLKKKTREIQVVPEILRGMDPDIEVFLQRKDASCGCMCLTRTGIFYIQPGDLKVFKASPWGSTLPLQNYQEERTALSVHAMQMYELACQQMRAGAVEPMLGQKQREFDHLLLHMLLSDIQSILLLARQDEVVVPISQEFKTCSLELLHGMLLAKVGSSRHVLETWLTKVPSDTFDEWSKTVRAHAAASGQLFCGEALHDDTFQSVWGIQNWQPSSTLVGDRFVIACELCEVDCWHTQPKFESRRGKWAHIGQIKYSIASLF